MNNVVNNPKTLARLWAALYCDFESLIARFMASKGWRYFHFAAICQQMQITLIMHITQGRGKTKDEHYNRITDMILEMCKELWLRNYDESSRDNKSIADTSMEMKRALGGFYLLYTMFEKQPCRGRVKISLGICDMVALNKFFATIRSRRLPCYDEVTFMLKYLDHVQAFKYCIYSVEFRFDAATRNFLNSSRSEVVHLTKRMRDTQDVLAYSSVHARSEKTFAILTALKHGLARDMQQSANPANIVKHMNNQSAFCTFIRTVSSESLKTAIGKLDKLLDKPVMTLQTLTATEAIDRRLMMETRRRMERARKKALLVLDRDGEHKAVRPYVREGGIFGRKKETEEGEDKTKRRERGACNGNLWIYINGHDFDKPMGNPIPEYSGDDLRQINASKNSPQAATQEREEMQMEVDIEDIKEDVQEDIEENPFAMYDATD